MRRWWEILLIAPLLVAPAGCVESPEYTPDEAEQAARYRVETAYEALVPPPLLSADALAQLLVEKTFQVMSIEGERSGAEPGVTLVVRVRQWLDKQGDWAAEGDDAYFCFRLHFGELHQAHPVDRVDCPTTPPLVYPTIEAAPPLPDEEAVRSALAGAAPEETVVRSALATLGIDPRITVDVTSADGAVGVGLRSRNSIGERAGCLLIRVAADSLEVWTLSGQLDQPGETSCDGFGALARDGQRSPH